METRIADFASRWQGFPDPSFINQVLSAHLFVKPTQDCCVIYAMLSGEFAQGYFSPLEFYKNRNLSVLLLLFWGRPSDVQCPSHFSALGACTARIVAFVPDSINGHILRPLAENILKVNWGHPQIPAHPDSAPAVLRIVVILFTITTMNHSPP
jgi:hypothetical protein